MMRVLLIGGAEILGLHQQQRMFEFPFVYFFWYLFTFETIYCLDLYYSVSQVLLRPLGRVIFITVELILLCFPGPSETIRRSNFYSYWIFYYSVLPFVPL
jgi:hypothetical protein